MSDGRWRLNVWATVKYQQGNRLIPNETVIFYSDGQETGERTTRAAGRTDAMQLFFPADTRKALIECMVAGDTLVADRADVEFGTSTTRETSDKFEPITDGSNGRYVVRLSIMAKDNKTPVSDVLVCISDTTKGDVTPVAQGRTDRDGHVSLPIPPFVEPHRVFKLYAPGTNFKPEELRLSGPMPKHLRKPPPPPELPEELEGGFSLRKALDAVANAWTRGKQDKKRVRS